MSENVKIAAVIPTFNRKEMLEQTLVDLYLLKKPPHIQFEIIVVVDGSYDGTVEMLSEKFKQVHVLNCENYWYTRSMNMGFRKAIELKSNYVLTLNDDIRLPDNFLSKILKAALNIGKPAIIGSLGISVEDPKQITSVGVKKINPISLKCIAYTNINIDSASGIHPSMVLPGRGMFIPVKILKELNFFDERFAQYQSDFDFCLRARKKGCLSYICYDAKVYNYLSSTSLSTSFFKKSVTDIIKQFFDKHSRTYIPAKARFIYRHGIKPIWPLSFLIFIVATFKANLNAK